MEIDARAGLRAMGQRLEDRLPQDRIAMVLDLLDRNEVPLALDQLCADIDESGVTLHPAEYLQLCELNTLLGQPAAPTLMRRLRPPR